MNNIYWKKVCAIIVTWNIGDQFLPNFRAVVHQVAKIVIIDNGSDTQTVLMLGNIKKQYPDKVEIIYNTINEGIGVAQNQGLDIALQTGFEWILLLDHDSRPEQDMVEILLTAFYSSRENGKIGLMAPNKKERNIDKEMKLVVPGFFCPWRTFGQDLIVENVQTAISSGSLIRKEVFSDIGRFNEAFFMDYIDTEFCLRMNKYGWRITVVRDAVLNHNFGDIQSRKFMGRIIGVTNHSRSRRYTIYRNRVVVWKQYIFVLPSYIFFDVSMAFYDVLKIILFESGRRNKLKAVFKGMLAGAVR